MSQLNYYDLADYIIGYCNKNKIPISNKKLQKLMYYCQAWSLALHEKELIDGDFEAWVHGAVFRPTYFKYSSNGYNNIEMDEESVDNIIEGVRKKLPCIRISLIEKVLERYALYSADELEEMTHLEDPWKSARGDLQDQEICDNVITKESMKEYYRSKAVEKGMKKMKKDKFVFSSTGLKKAQAKLREKEVFVVTKDNEDDYKDFILESRSKNMLLIERAETAQMLQKR